MAMCEMCGKKPSFGHNISHAANATPRRWMPNIQVTRVMINGEYQRKKLCTRCMRTLSKNPDAISKLSR